MKKAVEIAVLAAALLVLLFVGRSKLAVVYCNRGNAYTDAGRYASARDAFLRSLAIHPSSAAAHYGLGTAYRHLGDTQSAASSFRTAIERDSRSAQAYIALASLEAALQDYARSLATLAAAETTIGPHPEIRQLKQEITFEYLAFELNGATDAFIAGDHAQAYERVRRAIRIKDDYPFAHYTLGFFLYRDRRFSDAAQALRQALAVDGKMWLAHQVLGDIAFERAEYETAAGHYKAAVSVWSRSAQVYANLGLSFMNLERYEEAIEPLRHAVRLEPGNTSIRYSLASVYRDSGRLDDALREYAAVVQAQRDFPHVHNDIAAIYEVQGRREDALTEYGIEAENALGHLRVNPDDPRYLTSLATAYGGTGQFDKASAAVEKALSVAPQYREAYLAQARIYELTSRPQASLASLEKAKSLARHSDFISDRIATMKEALSVPSASPAPWRPTHEIVLRRGGSLRGVILEDAPERIRFETRVGATQGVITIERNTVERISAIE